MLFRGAVSWKAGKQDTVTTSSTEVELLAFTYTAKEAIAIKRLFEQISLKLDYPLVIECDNQQTIRLIKPDQPRIKTQLKHVDVHNCWARQAYKQGHFQVCLHTYRRDSCRRPYEGTSRPEIPEIRRAAGTCGHIQHPRGAE